MIKKLSCLVVVAALAISGCNFSPLSPSNKPNIKNNGEIGDIKNNQNGMMTELLNLKNRLDVIAQEVENLQNGFINHNNKNSGIQIFQGDGGLAVGLSIVVILALIAANYKIRSDRYKKTAELFGEKIKELNNPDVEEKILRSAMAKRVEAEAFKILSR
jgi:hypothetical protein